MITLQDILRNAGYETQSYSGRNMHGRYCLGVVLQGGVGQLFGDVLIALQEIRDLRPEDYSDAFNSMRTDSLGHDQIAYFPLEGFMEEDQEYPDDYDADE